MLQPYSTVPSYITKDGSEIRELMHPGLHSNKNQNLAEATVPVGGKTLLNKHTPASATKWCPMHPASAMWPAYKILSRVVG